MKRIVTIILSIAFVGLSALTSAQNLAPATKLPSYPISGTLSIKYTSRLNPDKDGFADVYTLKINAANSALFKGNITFVPFVSNTLGANQNSRVTFDMDLDVINPANIAQTRNVGKLFGSAPIDRQNVYHFDEGGGVKIAVLPIGAARGFESRFNGLALAKPPTKTSLWSSATKAVQEAVKLTSSKGGSITLTKYDKMTFQNHVLPAGPVQIYPETTVNGVLFYDYGRSAWHFNNVTFNYRTADGRPNSDTLTGSIRWVESPARKSNGEGEYVFDIRVNEPLPSETAIFNAVADESAFFETDTSIPSLTGSMKYKDTFSNGTVVASEVLVDLKSNNLTKQQVVYLAKLLLLSSVVPLNAE